MNNYSVNSLFSIEGKTAIITGGSGLLGQEISRFLEENGAIPVNFDINAAHPVDICDPDNVGSEAKEVIDNFGSIDVLIHAAAMNPKIDGDGKNPQFAPYEQFSLDLWDQEIRVNLTGAYICTRQIAPLMMKQKSGIIIFIASDLGIIAPQNHIYPDGEFKDIAYVTSKSGMLGLMRCWASYLSPHNIRVNALVPGGIDNGLPRDFVKKNASLNMMNRMANKHEYNGAIAFLASDASSYMTGSSLIIDGGRTAW